MTVLSLEAALIQDDPFPELNLTKLGLDGSPLALDLLEIYMCLHRNGTSSVVRQAGPDFRPSPHVLALFNPLELQVREPSHRADTTAPRESFQISRAGAAAMRAWDRLKTVELVNLDLHYTATDVPTDVFTRQAFFLFDPFPPSERPKTRYTVYWILQKHQPEAGRLIVEGARGPVLMRPVAYLGNRSYAIARSKIARGFLVLPNGLERAREQARTDVPAWLKIVGSIEEAV